MGHAAPWDTNQAIMKNISFFTSRADPYYVVFIKSGLEDMLEWTAAAAYLLFGIEPFGSHLGLSPNWGQLSIPGPDQGADLQGYHKLGPAYVL